MSEIKKTFINTDALNKMLTNLAYKEDFEIESVTFKQIRNKIREYSQEELFEFCHTMLDGNKHNERFPIWNIFAFIKWIYEYGKSVQSKKQLKSKNFLILFEQITTLPDPHITDILKLGVSKFMNVLTNQQSYLETSIISDTFAMQLKLYSTISKTNYDIEKAFLDKTGLSISDFLILQKLIFLLTTDKDFDGFLYEQNLEVLNNCISSEKRERFLSLLTISSANAIERISAQKRKITTQKLEPLGVSFLTLYPFQMYQNKIKLIHKRLHKYTLNYYIYDYMRENDDRFTTEFGHRFEKYIEFGLKEAKYDYKNEKQIKTLLPKYSNVVDYWIKDSNIFLDCKAIEVPILPSIKPTDKLLHSALKDSLLKAYFKQLMGNANLLSVENENWGIILTYKELFWGDFKSLYEIGIKEEQFKNIDCGCLKPENVFIIDIKSWEKIIQIVKAGEITLVDILQKVKENNSSHDTARQFFSMHLNDYKLEKQNMDYLQDERKQLESYFNPLK